MNALIAIGDVPIAAEDLDAARARDILDARTRQLARPPVRPGTGARILLFMLGGERFALPLTAIAEVAPAQIATPLPGAPPALLGLIVRRGLIYNLIDTAPALGVQSGEGRHMLLLRGPTPRLALRVDEAPGTTRLPEAGAPDAGGLTTDVIAADGIRVGFVALSRLVEMLGLARRE